MQDLLAHPAFQSAIAPFVCSLVVALILARADRQWKGLAVVAGILVAVFLITGLNFQPLTSTRKIILCSLVLPFGALIMVAMKCSQSIRMLFLSIAMASAAVWVIWPVLERQAGSELWMTGARVTLFAAAIGAAMSWLGRVDVPRQGGAILALGISIGATSFIAASALYSQLAFAVSAAAGGLLLVVLLEPMTKKFVPDQTVSGLGSLSLFAVAVPLGLIGGSATVFAQLPASALICLALIPVVAARPVFKQYNPWIATMLSTVLGLIPAVPAFWLAWSAAGSMSY